MKGLRKGFRSLLLTAVVFAHAPASTQRTNGLPDPWLNRARSLTDELVKDSDALGRYDRALLLARLGGAWQQDDAEQARARIEQAVQSVEAAPDKEGAFEYGERLNAARSLLVILGAHDKALSARLNKIINAASEAPAAPGENPENAKAKAEAALAVLDSDPRRAMQLGLASLRAGGSYKLASLLWRLRRRDVNLSDILFMEILTAARARSYDWDLLATLPTVAFEGPTPSDTLRGGLLGVLAEGLMRVPNSAPEQASICRLASIAAPLLPEFQRLLPQQAGMVRAQVAVCQPSLDPLTRKEVGDTLQDRPLNTVDDLLEAASRTPDLERRVTYRNRAASMAFGERQYDRAITILDGFSSEERETANRTMGGVWDNWRSSFASAAAVSHLRRGDRAMMYQVIAVVPQRLRAFVQMSVAAELTKKDPPAATQLLDEARAALSKVESPAFDSYLTLVRLYATLNPPDALVILRDAVKAMNRNEQSHQAGGDAADAEAGVSPLSSDALLARYALPVSLLETDDVGLRQVIASAALPVRRVAMRLKLLGASLAQRRAVTPKTAAELKGQDNADH